MSDTTLGLTPKLLDYLQDNSLREHPQLKELRRQTQKMSMSQMQISPEQGQFMQFLVSLLNAKKTLDIGVFTGYSALAVALRLPPGGQVVALDTNVEWTQIAERYWKKAGVSDKIDLRLAPAIDSLDQLITNGAQGSFDFAFIDADKIGYDAYFEKSLTLLRTGGVIVIDNVFQGGRVADLSHQEPNTLSIRALNAKLLHDERVDLSMLPVGDGLTLARKL